MTTVETAVGTAKTMVLNMGPQHPSTHGVLRILLELDGETVVKAVPDLGYLHTGIEKSCEDKTYSQAITLTDRMDYLNPLGNNLVYCQAVERFLKMMPSRVDEYETLLTENRIWIGRTKGVGYISAEDAVALSMTGPTLRAAGVAYDNRKAFPYSSYEEFKFDVPTRTESDCYARYLLRVAEMRESLKIIRQAFEKIKDEGAIKADAPGIIPPQREKMKTEMEALIYHFKIFTEGFSPAPGEAFVTVESPRGELGCFVASDGSPKPLRVHFRAPSYINLQALPNLIEGQLIADVIACIGTIDIVLGEVDR